MITMETIFAAIDAAINPEQDYLAQLPTVIAQLTTFDKHHLRQAVSMATLKGADNFRSDVILPEAITLLVVAMIQSACATTKPRTLELDAGIGTLSLALLEILPEADVSYMEVEPLLSAIFEATAQKAGQQVTAVELDETTQPFDLIMQNVDMETAAKNWQQLANEYETMLPQLLADDGTFVVLVPQVVLNESVFAPLRQALFHEFNLQAYIQLPQAFFVADDLAKGILILRSKQDQSSQEPIVLQLPNPQHQQQFAKSVHDLINLLAQQK